MMKHSLTTTFLLAISALAQTPPPTPELNWLISANVTPGPVINVGPVLGGNRTALPIQGGKFWGPYFNGTLLPAGVDAGLTTPDGGFNPDGIAFLQTEDEAVIIFKDVGYQLNDTIFGAVTFETGFERYKWLNSRVLVSDAKFGDGGGSVTLNIYVLGPIPDEVKKGKST